MAKIDFVRSVRTAAGFLNPTVVTDHPRPVVAKFIAGIIADTDMWLTPKSVEGFERNDFANIPKNELAKLEQSVQEFLTIARDKSPESDMVSEALTYFVQIVVLLQNTQEWRSFKPILEIKGISP